MPSLRRSGRSRGIGVLGDRAHLREEAAEPLGVVALEELGEPPPDELVLPVAEDPLDGGRVVANREVRREQSDDVARVLDERAEALGALALVQILGEVGALERERDLSGERLDAFARLLRQRLARVEDERCRPRRSTRRAAPSVADAICRRRARRDPSRRRPTTPSDASSSTVSVLASPTISRAAVDRDAVDVLARPRGDERGRGGCRERARAAPSARAARRGRRAGR